MEFSGSWPQVLRNSLIDFYSCIHDSCVQLLHSVLETCLQETLQNRAEDLGQGCLVSIGHTEHVEVTSKSQGYGASTTTWGCS